MLGSFDVRLGLALLAFLALTGVGLPLMSRRLSQDPAEDAIQARAGLKRGAGRRDPGPGRRAGYGQQVAAMRWRGQADPRLNRVQERLAVVRGLGEGLAALFTGLAALTVLWLAIPLVSGGRLDGVYLALLPLAAIRFSFGAVQPLGQASQYLESGQARGAAAVRADRRAAGRRPGAGSPILRPIAGGLACERHRGRSASSAVSGDYSLEINGLRFAYAAGEPAVLDGLDLAVLAGGRVRVGASGSGKTTLVYLLVRFWDYREGQIRLGGRELRTRPAEEVRGLLSVVSQETHLFNTTVRDNLRLANPDVMDV